MTATPRGIDVSNLAQSLCRLPRETLIPTGGTEMLYNSGFQLSRINGSHHIYVHANIPELLNIQNVNGQAKPYQVKQLLRLIERYNLEMGDES